jgi:hypothetical protein
VTQEQRRRLIRSLQKLTLPISTMEDVVTDMRRLAQSLDYEKDGMFLIKYTRISDEGDAVELLIADLNRVVLTMQKMTGLRK